MSRLAGVIHLLIATASPICSAHGQSSTTTITNVNVVDVVSGTVLPDMTVVISGNRIARIGRAAQVAIPENTRAVNGLGKFLIPGLWDMHVHLGNATDAAFPLLLAAGITGVRDMGSPNYHTLHRWSVEALSGARVGPRIVAPGPILTSAAAFYWQMYIGNPEQGRRAVDQLANEGVDFIKVTSSLTRDTYFAVADEARRLNLPLVGHLPERTDGMGFTVSAIEASNAGHKSLEHLLGIPFNVESLQKDNPDLIPTLLRNGTYVCPTLVEYSARAHVHELAAQDDPRLKHISPNLKQFWDGQMGQFPKSTEVQKQVLAWRMAAVPVLNKAGVPLLAGTDLGFPYVFPGDLLKELELFVEAGISPLDALRTATINPARFLKLDSELGSVQTGKIADLVLLDGNPLEDIKNLRRLVAVIANGRFFDRASIESLVPNT